MSLDLIAHSENEDRQPHDLVSHLSAVSELAAGFASKFGGHQLAKYLGLWHDLGKFHPDWQAYVRSGRRGGGPDHKWAGAKMARELPGHAALSALAVHGHHGGMKSVGAFKGWFNDEDKGRLGRAALVVARSVMPTLDPPDDTCWLPSHATESILHLEFFLRMVFACLVDSDHLDTERHVRPRRSSRRGGVGLHGLREAFEEHCQSAFADKSGRVNETRRTIREDCLNAAAGSSGLYSFTAPTGSGKTLSAMAFALAHAARHDMDRVIYAAPFVNVTSQTAQAFRNALKRGADTVATTEQAAEVFRDALGADAVLEHHSDSPWRRERADGTPWARWSEVSSENWDAPVIVTTTVQFLESLFSNRPGRCRKNHRMANAVILLDEPQAIPNHIIKPSLDALNSLASHYGSTVVLATATQPAFKSIHGLDIRPTEIVDQVEDHFDVLRRVSYEWDTEDVTRWSELASRMMATRRRQALAIVNTRDHAQSLLNALVKSGAPEPMLLSTRLCSKHRAQIVKSVNRRLRNSEPCLLVSTQIVEAGVDLDFPAVWREFAPLPSVAQAAGRCNREGRMEGLGTLTVFRVKGTRKAAEAVYGQAIGVTEGIVSSSDFELGDPEKAMAKYFLKLYSSLDLGGGLDRDEIQTRRANGSFPYEEIARDFKVIEDDQHSVVVTKFEEHGTDVRDWLRELDEMARDSSARDPARARRLRRRLQPYLVALHRWEFERASAFGMTGTLGAESGFPEWVGRYDANAGLMLHE